MFASRYADVFKGDEKWRAIDGGDGQTIAGHHPPTSPTAQLFQRHGDDAKPVEPLLDARILALFGDSITTDHISPAGSIKESSPAGEYLKSHQVPVSEFNSYGSRRGNHEVMMRGTFANIRIKNQMLDGIEGGYTKYEPSGEQMAIYDAAMKYKEAGSPLVIFAGKEYGTGSSRDWAAKGTVLLGVRAVIAESFERIHRSNLIGMGVLPLQFKEGDNWRSLGLKGDERVSVNGIDGIKPRSEVKLSILSADGSLQEIFVLVRIDTADELDYYKHGGILPYVVRQLASA
ncbi:MAG: hypothetical protein R3C60_04065 [Parvularculaceae bacterium]